MEVKSCENPIPLKKSVTQRAIEGELSKLNEVSEKQGIFLIKSGKTWLNEAKLRPVPQSLFFNVWFEGEVCLLFAETNTGKSILAVQIANDVSKNQPVIYFDFELSSKQFEARYSKDFTNHFEFADNFLRAEINPDEADYHTAGFSSLEDYINDSIEKSIIETGARVLVIDNLTYLRCETEKAREALPLMKHLKTLKNKYDLSILCLGHTPKRSQEQPLNRNDLQGSKMLINFCDSSFAIGESRKDKKLRYLKQIKSRNSEIVYDADNVAVFEITKPENFLSFTYVHTSCEHEHLKQISKEDKEDIINQIILLNSKGNSYRQIRDQLGVSLGYISNVLKGSRSPTGEQL